MSWKLIEMQSFLKERKERYKPNDKKIAGLQRIEKIDFSGNIFLSDKTSKTNMILVKSGDLVISGINVEKGAMSVYHGNNDVKATIHYSSYEYDKEKIDIGFLKHFLKSAEFKKALKEQVPGGIKTEIKPKHILPLKVFIPTNIKEQKKVVEYLNMQNSIINVQSKELTHQLELVKKLRQAFLREAMQGKLVEQNPSDEPASELLAKIKAEKEQLIKEKKIKKQNPLSPIAEEEIPFKIPKNWIWCRLKNIVGVTGGGTPSKGRSDYWNGNIPWISPKDMKSLTVSSSELKVTEKGVENSSAKMIPKGSLLIVGRSGILKRMIPVAINEIECTVNQDMKVLIPFLKGMSRFIQFLLLGMEGILLKEYVKFGMTVHSLKYSEFEVMPIPLPPLAEQKRIVAKLDKLMSYCDRLEESIKNSQKQNEMLLGQVLREALEPKEITAKEAKSSK